MGVRKVIHWDFLIQSTLDIPQTICIDRALDWEVVHVQIDEDLPFIVNKHNVSIGLMSIDEQVLERYCVDIESVLDGLDDIEWIGLIPPSLLGNEKCRRLIAKRFYDYHSLPIDIARLTVSMGRAYGMALLNKGVIDNNIPLLCQELKMVGHSEPFQKVQDLICKFSNVCAPVLITGESGTGKELVARAIHRLSSRSNLPMMAVNCAAIPENLIQSELFGHEKGAYTGAANRKTGRIEAASGGTLFLDEIGDLPLPLQVNLLRFMQEGTIERLGGNQSISVDVRVVAATHVDLEGSIQNGEFREDLYYRLNVLRINVPPLRGRPEDIDGLADYFFGKFVCEREVKVKGFSQQSREIMRLYGWPGNIRELMNRIRRAILLCEGRTISPLDLGFDKEPASYVRMSLAEAREEAEKKVIASSLRYAGNNISAASKLLDISRLSLYRLMSKHNMYPHKS